MYINRALLFVLAATLIFLPSVEDWLLSPEAGWYRPYQLWLLIIVATYWNQRSRYNDEL